MSLFRESGQQRDILNGSYHSLHTKGLQLPRFLWGANEGGDLVLVCIRMGK